MVVLRPTRKLQKLLPVETDGEQQSDGALGDWYVYWLGVDQRVIDAEVATMQPVRLAATKDRSVMGIVIQCCKEVALHLPINGWNDASLVEAEAFLRQTPWHASRRDFVIPQKKAAELLNARWETRLN